MFNIKKNVSILSVHRFCVFIIYFIAFVFSYYLLKLTFEESTTTRLLIISTGAILATFGSALGAIGSVWERDLYDSVLTNVDILYVDLLKKKKWRRWPFIPRISRRKLLDETKIVQKLENDKLPLNVGTHQIEIDIPTVLADFFDLPVLENTYKILRFRSAASTKNLNNKQVNAKESTVLDSENEYMAYECIHSVWLSVFKFRCFRYVVHFGSALTISGAVNTLYYVVQFRA